MKSEKIKLLLEKYATIIKKKVTSNRTDELTSKNSINGDSNNINSTLQTNAVGNNIGRDQNNYYIDSQGNHRINLSEDQELIKNIHTHIINEFEYINIVNYNFNSNSSNSQLLLNEYYQKLEIGYNNSTICESSLLNKINNHKKVNFLIKGDIGSGKTTLIKYLVFKILNNQQYDKYSLVIYIRLKDIMDEKNLNITDLIKKQYARVLKQDSNVIYEFNDKKTLIILDGLHSINSKFKNKFYEIIKGYHTIILSRNNSINLKELYVNETFEVKGFNLNIFKDQIDKYGKKKIMEESDIEISKEKIIEFLKKLGYSSGKIYFLSRFLNKNENLFKIAQKPLILMNFLNPKFLSNEISDINILDENIYEFFIRITNYFSSEYNEHIENENMIYGRKYFNTTELQELAMNDLENLAYKSFLMNKHIDQEIINETLKSDEFEDILKLGLLTTNELFNNNIENSKYKFINELFKSVFIARKINDSKDKKIILNLLIKLKENFKYIETHPKVFNSRKEFTQRYDKMYQILNKDGSLDIYSLLNRLLRKDNNTESLFEMSSCFLNLLQNEYDIAIQLQFINTTGMILEKFEDYKQDFQIEIDKDKTSNVIKYKFLLNQLELIEKNHRGL